MAGERSEAAIGSGRGPWGAARPERDAAFGSNRWGRGLAAFSARSLPAHVRWSRLAMVWLGLVGVIVVGRLLQPAYNVTPLTAVALVAGAVFPSTILAATVPVAGLALGNLIQPGYGSLAMATIVFAACAAPVSLRSWVRSGRALHIAAGGLVGAVTFFVVTNVAYWWLSNDYPHTIEGLGACFVNALPFFRWQPVGDVVWSLGLVSLTAAIGHRIGGPVTAGGEGAALSIERAE